MGALLADKVAVCDRIDVLTGYFFFDGFSGLGTALKTNTALKLRVLVGMDAGLDTRGLVYRVYEYETSQPPSDCSQEYLQTLRSLLAHPDPKSSLTSEQAGLYATFSNELSKVGGGDFYEKVIGHYFGGLAPKFRAAMYQPEKYLSTSATAVQRQGNLSKMLRRFLVMRWESSPAAFKATVGHVKDWLQAAVKKF